MAKNLTENVENYTVIFEIFDCRHIFGLSTYVKNVPEFLYHNFWFLQYIFPKLYPIPKLLPEHMALLSTLSNTPFKQSLWIILK